jgi:hypothetical protein
MNVGIITSARPYFLDNFPSATLAVSLRRLNRNYSGNCIRVRRSSDNTEQDIGFVNGALDQSSLTSFVGAGNGFVTIWYDQSGSGNNLSNSTAASQPKIVTSGAILTQSGFPCISTATNLFLRSSGVLFNGGTSNFIAAIGSHTSANTGFFGNRPAAGSAGWFYDWRTTNTYQLTNVGFNTTAYTSTPLTRHITFLSRASSNALSGWWNNIAGSTGGTGYGSSSIQFYLGVDGTGGTNYFANANFYEVIGYTSDQTANRTRMQTNVNSYYSIY